MAVRTTDAASPPPGYRLLIQAATVEFSHYGREGARVDKIARRAKVNKQLVYHYFGSKDGLYYAVLEQAYMRFRGDDDAIRKAINGVDAVTALRQLARFLFGRKSANTQFNRLLQDANIHGGRGMSELKGVREAYSFLLEAVAEVLKRGEDEGVFRPGIDHKEFYISLIGACAVRRSNAATLSYALDVDLVSEEGAAKSQDYAISLLLEGIRR